MRFDLAAERSLLGVVLATSGRVLDDLGVLPGDFHDPRHADLWTLMLRMHEDRIPVEPVAFAGRLVEQPIRGVEGHHVADLYIKAPVGVAASHFAQMVTRLARVRRIQEANVRIGQRCESADLEEIEDLVAAVRDDLDKASSDRTQASDWTSMLTDAMGRWETREDGVLPTGWADLDRLMAGGLRPGHLVVIGARPAMGKSLVGGVLASQVARAGHGVLVSSQEMSHEEYVDRLAADMSGVTLTAITERTLGEDDWSRLSRTYTNHADLPLEIDDRPSLTVAAIRGRARDVARKLQARAPLKLVVVDYLQLLRPSDGRAPREQQVAGMSRQLKLLAREMGVTVVALAQLNRRSTERLDKRPTLTDLRESGSMEQDADEVLLLHRDDEERPGELDLIVAKNRHGRTGTVTLAWSPEKARVRSLAS